MERFFEMFNNTSIKTFSTQRATSYCALMKWATVRKKGGGGEREGGMERWMEGGREGEREEERVLYFCVVMI